MTRASAPAAALPGDRPLRILLQTLDFPPDRGLTAIGLYTRSVAEGMAARGHAVHVLSRGNGDGVTRSSGVTVHRIGPARPAIPAAMTPGAFVALAAGQLIAEAAFRRRLATALEAIVEREGIELVEACDSGAEALCYRPGRRPRVPFVVRLHTPTAVWELFDRNVPEVGRMLVRAFERRLLTAATHLTAPSDAAAALFVREMGLGGRPVAVYPNPPTYDRAVGVDGGEADPATVLFVGRLTPGKGVTTLAESVPLVLAEIPEARFVLVGPDGPTSSGFASMRAYLERLVPEPLRRAVEFTGHLPHEQVALHLARATVCVFPSRFEAFGYACLEAMSHGKAIVAGDRGGMAELLGYGECGLLFEPADAALLARHIVALLRDRPLRRALGERARRRAAIAFGREAILDRIERFYRSAVLERAAPSRTGPVRSAGASGRRPARRRRP